MVTILLLPSKIMCNTTSNAVNFLHSGSKRQLTGRSNHKCAFKLIKCSSQQLCVLCFLLYQFASGNAATVANATSASSTTLLASPTTVSNTTLPSPTTISPPEGSMETTSPPEGAVECVGESCYMKITSSEEALNKMTSASEHLFNSYATTNDLEKSIDSSGLEKFYNDITVVKDEGHDHGDHEGHDHGDHEGHDHGDHEGHDHGDHEGHDHGDYDYSEMEWSEEYADYFPDSMRPENRVPCISSFKDLIKTYLQPNSSDEIKLSLGDFITIMPQLLLMQTPLCKKDSESEMDEHEEHSDKTTIEHSTRNIWLISFGSVLVISLVSLLGVMMIPLLRHSKLLNQVIAFLVALAVGCLVGDALLHLLPHASGAHDHSGHAHAHGEGGDDDHFDSMWKGLVACGGIYIFFLLETIMGFFRGRKSSQKHTVTPHNHDDHSCESPNSSTPSDPMSKTKENIQVFVVDEEIMDTGHNHHHSHEVPKTIASLAYMIIVGDGLHNMTDGLAIGAAFSSSIGAGLSTSLAIFFHEIPQELGDFAILLNAGMSVKQALLCNFLSACMCFVGLVIGLLVGEYTNGIILWILAFTAGGFLYIALVDMLPSMIKQLDHSDYLRRFVVQNIGLLSGFAIMTIIALNEESFMNYF